MSAAASAPYRLRFSLGERTLFTVTRELARREATLLQILDGRPPPLEFGGGGLLYRSYPADRLPALGSRPDAIIYVRETYPRYYAELSGTFDAYLARMSSNARSGLKRKEKAWMKHAGALDVREYRTPEALDAFFPAATELSARTYQDQLLDAGLPTSPAFRAEAARRAALGEVRAYLLFRGASAVSYLYAPVRDGVVLYDFLGYDPAYAQHSVGGVLQLEVMRRLFAEGGLRYFDFTPGGGQHKRQFATGEVRCADVILLPDSPANRLVVASHRGFNRTVERAGSLAERWGVKSRLRRLLRGQ